MMTAGDGGGMTASMRREEFDVLAQRSRQRVYSRAYGLLQNANEAEDVVQEALIKAWCSYPQFDGRNWEGWLHRIVTNTALNRLAVLKRTQRLSVTEPSEDGSGDDLLSRIPGSITEQPEHQVMARERREQLAAAMNTLPGEWATMLRLYAVDELSYDQIGVRMNCSPGTVRSRIHRARARLQAVLTNVSSNIEC
jgi:RNA polymerase sigma-70 factor, ECF subfamily